MALGLAVIVLNDLMLLTTMNLLPWGHREMYLGLGLAIGASRGIFFGMFDKPS